MKRWSRALYQPCWPLGMNGTRVTDCDEHRALSRAAAGEGAVLLKNNNKVLPLRRNAKVALFGKAQIDYVKGGGGSGTVLVSYVKDIYRGLKEKEVPVFDKLSLYYEGYVQEQYALGNQRGQFDEAPLPADLLEEAAAYTDTAIITINRYSRESWDRYNNENDNYFNLSPAEKEMVEAVTARFKHIIVLLNVGAMIDTAWFAENDTIDAAVMLWQGGMEGGGAAADILLGQVNPSGKLVDTCAKTFEDYPSSELFHECDDYARYTEDIFVGYRYFETVPGKKERVVYPFGYGLSYTQFEMEKARAFDDGETVYITVTVKNVGKIPGKEVVQVYYSAPQGKLGKAERSLCAFQKTKLLKPGQSEKLILSFTIKNMASFDDLGLVAKSCNVLEKGTYRIYVGNSVRDAKELDYTYELAEDVITEQLHSYCAPERLGKRMIADGTYVDVPDCKAERTVFPCTYKLADVPEEPITLLDVAEKGASLDAFIAQLTTEEMIHLVKGVPSIGVSCTSGFGSIEERHIPPVMTIDGPAGVRIDRRCEVNCTAFPVATALACTWNLELMEQVGRAGALEAKENNLQIWLTPALNIHRSPLCGRNFEYFSEDPFVSGKMAAACIRGIESQGIAATAKHLACNNKETNRKSSDSIVSERALREIYLKGFEICVKEAQPQMVMSSYNLLNGIYTSANQELLEGILRREWGFKGMVVSDWTNKADHVEEIKAGNDVRMPKGDAQYLMDAVAEGRLTRKELAVCVKRLMKLILWIGEEDGLDKQGVADTDDFDPWAV